MKKIALLLLILNISLTSAYSFELFKKDSKAQVRQIMNEHTKAMSNHDVEKVKSFYIKDYKSTDGFDLAELERMLNKTYSTYSNIKYKTKISSINAYDDWALVQMSDKSSAYIFPTEDKNLKKEKMGKLDGKSVYNVYLKKINNEWKIVSDDILLEETSLKFGVARKINMDIVTPLLIKNGQEYDLSLKIDKPKDLVALASISREEIVYPPVDSPEKFRKISQEGELERLVKANDKNLDEYAVASIGFTKVSVNEEQTKAKIEVLGMAYLMKRINMEKARAGKL
jgi:ketosteroid isomerase-like protein